MRRFLICVGLTAFAAMPIGVAVLAPNAALAQATCRNKCNDEEQACLKRTGNKGQCGNSAKSCLGKCK